MNRRVVNIIRNMLDNWMPPVIRDSALYSLLLKIYFKEHYKYISNFRKRVRQLSFDEYCAHYENVPDIMGETDLNQPCIDEILANAKGERILDVGCGRGYLANKVYAKSQAKVHGVDIAISQTVTEKYPEIEFHQSDITKLPFDDNYFDTVLCTHTLEHILDFHGAISELKRVCRNRIIIVVPLEREYLNGFNLHVQFFAYPHSFLNRVPWNTDAAIAKDLDGDIYFQQDL